MIDTVIINGNGGVGKTTFVEYCIEYYGRAKTFNFSTIDCIKEIAQKIGWNGEKTERDRKFLSDLKELVSSYNNFPFYSVTKKINDKRRYLENYDFDKYSGLYFVDCREPKEIDRLKKELNAVSLLITNPKVKPIMTNMADANVLNYDYDYHIINDGSLKQLSDYAKNFIIKIKETE